MSRAVTLLTERIPMSGWILHFMNQHAAYIKWGWFQISVSNLIVILSMLTIFALALFLPFPHDEEEK